LSSDESRDVATPAPRRPLIRRFLTGLTLKRVVAGITSVAFGVTVIAAFLMRLVEPDKFDTFQKALWWSAQTVSTVGYGDIVPTSAAGQALGIVVMLFGIALVPALTSLVVAVFLNQQAERVRSEDPEA
jgi:voltage-gated potassium channel